MHERNAIDDCWNKVGVRGDASCPLLAEHIHCRNCPIYSSAAVRLLDAELSVEDQSGWTRHIAQDHELFGDRDTHSILVFRVGTEWLGLATRLFREIANCGAIHSLPHRRGGAVLGLANVRGELLACMSLLHVLGIEPAVGRRTGRRRIPDRRLLVIQRDGQSVVCPVDEVHGIERFHPQKFQEVPATVAKASSTYTKAVLAWSEKWIGVLDEQLLFDTFKRGVSFASEI
jgi:chemotaxis-related protein WspD